jgi:hypothetical protein
MQPVRRAFSSPRNLPAVCAAVIVGILVGGASVLAVAFAVIEPPSQDAPAGSAVFDGRPHVVQQAPAATSEEPQTAAAAPAPTDSAPIEPIDKTTTATVPPAKLPAEPVTPADAKAGPAAQQQTPTQVLNKTWPDVPSARQPLKPESAMAAPPTNAPKPNAPAQTASVQGNGDNSSALADKGHSQTKTTRTVTSHDYAPRSNTQTAVVPNGDAQQRVVVIPGNAPQPRDDDREVASTGAPRPLFDFFGHGPFGDEGQRDDNRNVTSVPSPAPQLRTARNPRDPQLVIRHRQDRDDDAVKSGPPQYNSGNNFFGFGRDDN